MYNYINAISDFIFYEDELMQADIIMIPGTSRVKVPEKAAELYQKGYASKILVSGLYNINRNGFPVENIKENKYKKYFASESEFLKTVLLENGVSSEDIMQECISRNTLENALISKEIIEKSLLNISTAIVCCQAFHARRVQMTYSIVFPNIKLIIYPIISQNIGRNNWYLSETGIKRVLGEVERCGKYFKKDIVDMCINKK